MVSRKTAKVPILNPDEVRVQRDKAIALAFVKKGESSSAAREIIAETGVNRRTVYRAIKRQLAWARSQVNAPAPCTNRGDDPTNAGSGDAPTKAYTAQQDHSAA